MKSKAAKAATQNFVLRTKKGWAVARGWAAAAQKGSDARGNPGTIVGVKRGIGRKKIHSNPSCSAGNYGTSISY